MVHIRFNRIVFIFVMFGLVASESMLARSVLASHSQSTNSAGEFKEFRDSLRGYGRATYGEAKFLWKWGLKKLRHENISKAENDRAKKIGRKIGMSLVMIATLAAITTGAGLFIKSYRQEQEKKKQLEIIKQQEEQKRKEQEQKKKDAALNKLLVEGAKEPKAIAQVLSQGANPNTLDEQGRPLILRAILTGNIQAVDDLIAAKADLNFKDDFGQTPLMLVAQPLRTISSEVKQEIAFKLIKAGADINAQGNQYGETALHIAAREGNEIMAKMLLDNKADSTIKTKGGQTAADIAIQSKYPTIVDMIKAYAEPKK